MARSVEVKSTRGGAYRKFETAAEAGLPDNTVLHIADPRDLLTVQSLCQDRNVSIVLLDVNDAVGNDLPLDLLALSRSLSRVLGPSLRAMLIKSRALDRLRAQLTTAAEVKAKFEAGVTPSPLRSG